MEARPVSLQFEGKVDLGRFVLDAAFDCAPGETIALVGPNGSGKSTALNVMAGLLRLSAGSLTIDGTTLDEPSTSTWAAPERRGVGVVFQDLLLFPHLNIRDNVAYGPRRAGVAKDAAADTAMTWLERFGVEDLAEARPRSLSGGQAQRVALARALARNPRVLLLDEPLSALDSATRLEVRHELHRHLGQFEGMTVVVAHDAVDVLVLAHRVIVLDDGRVAQIDEPAALERRPRTAYAAALVGTNLLRGVRRGPVIDLGGGASVAAVRPGSDGPVDVVVAPRHVTVVPAGESARPGTWNAPVAGLEAAGNEVHIRVGGAAPLAALESLDALRDLHLAPGARVSVEVDPAHVAVFDDPTPHLALPESLRPGR
jgi:molybdate transport system ATP-binding protein